MTLNLEQNEAQFILNVLGELPSKSGAWPLIVKIQAQAKDQEAVPAETPAQE